MTRADDGGGRAGDEAEVAQLARDEHHREEQHDGVAVDGGVALGRGERADSDHEHGAQERARGAADGEHGEAAARDEDPGEAEDGEGEEFQGGLAGADVRVYEGP